MIVTWYYMLYCSKSLIGNLELGTSCLTGINTIPVFFLFTKYFNYHVGVTHPVSPLVISPCASKHFLVPLFTPHLLLIRSGRVGHACFAF